MDQSTLVIIIITVSVSWGGLRLQQEEGVQKVDLGEGFVGSSPFTPKNKYNIGTFMCEGLVRVLTVNC